MREIFFNIVTVPREYYDNNIYLNRKSYFEKNSFFYSTLSEEEKKTYITSSHWALCKIICITGKISDGHNIQDFKMFSTNEFNLINAFVEIINENKNSLWIHYNGLTFGVPLIIRRAIKYNLLITNNDFKNLVKFRTYPHYDCSSILGNWSIESILDFHSACKEFEIDFNNEPIIFNENNKDNNKDYITDFSIRKTKALYDLYNKMRKNI